MSDTSGGTGPHLMVLCTGNAARSVMAGFMLSHLSEVHGLGLRVDTAGTLTVDGHPMSLRTRAALTSIPEMADAPVGAHRSRQLHGHHLHGVDLVIAMEADHVRYVHRHHPVVADRTAVLRRLVEILPPGPPSLADRVAALQLAGRAPLDEEDVADPAGRDEAVYRACAEELWDLCRRLVPLL